MVQGDCHLEGSKVMDETHGAGDCRLEGPKVMDETHDAG